MDFLSTVSNNKDVIDLGFKAVEIIFAVIGGGFALHQWRIQIKQKRSDIAEDLIGVVRGDKDITEIMDMIDWAKGFYYDGEFHFTKAGQAKYKYSDEELFIKIDKTLAHFSYICYLLKCHSLSSKEKRLFEYELRRFIDNEHIKNYLYSLYHWSKHLDVKCSYSYLIDYSVKRKYITRDFYKRPSDNYVCHLIVPSKPKKRRKGTI